MSGYKYRTCLTLLGLLDMLYTTIYRYLDSYRFPDDGTKPVRIARYFNRVYAYGIQQRRDAMRSCITLSLSFFATVYWFSLMRRCGFHRRVIGAVHLSARLCCIFGGLDRPCRIPRIDPLIHSYFPPFFRRLLE